MSTKQETETLVGQRVAARIDLSIKAKGERVGSIGKGTKGTIVTDETGGDGIERVRVRWDEEGNAVLRIKRTDYTRALVEIED